MKRRNFIKNLATASSLCGSLSNSIFAGDKMPGKVKNVLFICTSLGFLDKGFYPKSSGKITTLPDYFQSWKELSGRFSIFSGLSHPGMAGTLHNSELSFLTGAPYPNASGFKNTISIDQAIVAQIGLQTRIPYLNMSLGPQGLVNDESGIKIPPVTDSEAFYDFLFHKRSAEEIHRQKVILQQKRHMLSQVSRDQLLQNQTNEITCNFNRKMEQLDQVFATQLKWLDKDPLAVKEKLPHQKPQESDLMLRLDNFLCSTRLAFASDTTRTAVMHIPFYNQRVTGVRGIQNSWHRMTHGAGGKGELALMERTLMQRIGNFLTQLKRSKDIHGNNLLDNTVVLIGSNLGAATSHDTSNLPIVVAGGGFDHGNYIKHDRKKNVPLAQLYLSIANQIEGVKLTSFQGETQCLKRFNSEKKS